jgi:formate hydrogenlyase subunit 3/multisubunit Na+/H+ antiporter MnhD subunit
LIAAMIMVVLANDAMTFLISWEVVSLATYLLLIYEHERPQTRAAGWTYLIATHLGTALLIVFFLVVGEEHEGTLRLGRSVMHPSAPAVFLLAVIGFGTKAGLFPFHVWLPDTYANAPAHVTAVFTGAASKLGIYGLIRGLTYVTPYDTVPPVWCGTLLIALGCVSGLFGIVFALPQRDLRRVLAYSSIENLSLITLGVGLGTLGWSTGADAFALLGFGGAILHVWNHAFFKSGLFLVTGAVERATGTSDLTRLGGLLQRLPRTGVLAAILVLGITALPPLNGFCSELVLYTAALAGLRAADPGTSLPSLAALAVLVAISGLAAVVFANVFGTTFLGQSRSAAAAEATEAPRGLRVPITILVVLCVVLALAAGPLLRQVAAMLSGPLGLSPWNSGIDETRDMLGHVALAGGGLAAMVLLLAGLRWWLLRAREVKTAGTWDCGYAEPTARMQYTAASFVEPATTLLNPLLRARDEVKKPEGLFPTTASYASGATISIRDELYGRAFTWIAVNLGRLRRLQHGHVHLYVLYVALTLLALLFWRLS